MKTTLKWLDKMIFEGQADGHIINMDAKSPIGSGSAPTPKELVLLGLGGCTAMDVIALLKKHKQLPTSLTVEVEVTNSQGVQPAVFTRAQINFQVSGDLSPDVLLESVKLSQTRFCGVSAMLSVAFPIEYVVWLNQKEVGRGKAEFSINKNNSNLGGNHETK